MIRKFQSKDAKNCSEIMLLCIDNSLHYYGKNKEFMIKMSQEDKIIEKSKIVDFFVYEEDEKILATGVFDNGEIRTMFVNPLFQGKGIGRAMLLFLINHAKECGHKNIFLKSSPEAEGFYEKNGFMKIKEEFEFDFHTVLMEKYI